MSNLTAQHWTYALAGAGAAVCASAFVPWATSAAGVAEVRPGGGALVILLLCGGIPPLLGLRVLKGAAAARSFLWVLASIDLVGWLVLSVILLIAHDVGRLAHPDAGLILCWAGSGVVFLSTVFLQAKTAGRPAGSRDGRVDVRDAGEPQQTGAPESAR
jgi:hypothetical protein